MALRAAGTHAVAVGFVAIQRAGKVAVAIDPTAPAERVATILADVEASLLLSDVDGDEDLGLPAPVAHPLQLTGERTPVDRPRGELVSIVYTSGSTGAPKGIMVGRDAFDALLTGMDKWGAIPEARVGQILAGTVAHTELSIMGVLSLRGTLVAYEIRRHQIAPLADWIDASRIEFLSLVPTVLRFLLAGLAPDRRFSHVRRLSLGGETATWEDVVRLRPHVDRNAVIVNVLGQSESLMLASFEIPATMPAGLGPLPAGRPISGIEVVILDEDGHELPAGQVGEIVTRSHVCALGYWRRPELTPGTFRELPDGRRQVRTGDAGRLRPDGILEHRGRLDHLVKVYGNRIELGEVEAELHRLEGIEATAVATYLEGEHTRLVACIVPEAGRQLDARVLRTALARRVPGYMVPSRIAFAPQLPQLPGGKIDRAAVAALPDAGSEAAAADEDPVGPLETELAAIWCQVLGLERVGRHDSFFAIGGDSLRAAQMIPLIAKRLGFDRPVSLLAEAPTIASLALMLESDAMSWDAPMAIRTEGARPPLFVIHDGQGSLLFARGLAEALGEDQPIYGLRCRLLDGGPARWSSFQEFAAGYVARIQDLYPEGPYLFYGVSMGGLIALEVARQLLAAGSEVPLVILGNSVPVPTLQQIRRMEQRRELAARGALGQGRYLLDLLVGKLAHTLSSRGERHSGDGAVAAAAAPHSPVAPELRASWAFQIMFALAGGYASEPPFPDRVLLLRAGGLQGAHDRGWGPLLGDRLHIVDVPVLHAELGQEASAGVVGPVLARALEERLAQA